MKTKEVEVFSRAAGGAIKAHLSICDKCGGDTFLIYFIPGGMGDHPHIQCTNCDETFCQGGCPAPDWQS